jgi:hypothetical protein
MFVSVIAFLAASAVQATELPATAPANPPPAVKEKKICRTEQLIGSMIPKRVCKIKSEWNGQAAAKRGEQSDKDLKSTSQSGGSAND